MSEFKIELGTGDAGGFALLAFANVGVFDTGHRATPGSAVLASTAKLKVTVKRGTQETSTTVTVGADDTAANKKIGDDRVRLLRADNSATFATVQDLVFRLATMLGVSDVVEYDGTSDALLLNIGSPPPRLALQDTFDLSFDVDLGSVAEITTDAQVLLKADAGIDPEFVLGIYLGSNVPGAQQGMTGTTPLAQLNGNEGVDIQSAPAITAAQPVATQLKPLAGEASFSIARGESVTGVAGFSTNTVLNDASKNFVGRVFVGDQILNLSSGEVASVINVSATQLITSALLDPIGWTGDTYQTIPIPRAVTVPATAADGTMAALVTAVNTAINANSCPEWPGGREGRRQPAALRGRRSADAEGLHRDRRWRRSGREGAGPAHVGTGQGCARGRPAGGVQAAGRRCGVPPDDRRRGLRRGGAPGRDPGQHQHARAARRRRPGTRQCARRVSDGVTVSLLPKVMVEGSGFSLMLRIVDKTIPSVQFSAALDDPAVLELGLTNEATLTLPTLAATRTSPPWSGGCRRT